MDNKQMRQIKIETIKVKMMISALLLLLGFTYIQGKMKCLIKYN